MGYNPFVPHPKFVTALSAVTGLWTVRVKLYRIVLRTRIHASFPVVAARKVQAPFRIELGYARFLNSCSFVLALCTINSFVLAIFSTCRIQDYRAQLQEARAGAVTAGA